MVIFYILGLKKNKCICLYFLKSFYKLDIFANFFLTVLQGSRYVMVNMTNIKISYSLGLKADSGSDSNVLAGFV